MARQTAVDDPELGALTDDLLTPAQRMILRNLERRPVRAATTPVTVPDTLAQRLKRA